MGLRAVPPARLHAGAGGGGDGRLGSVASAAPSGRWTAACPSRRLGRPVQGRAAEAMDASAPLPLPPRPGRGTGGLVRRATARGTAEAFSAGLSGRRIPVSAGTYPLSRDKEVWPSPQSAPRHREGYGRGLLHRPVLKRDGGTDAPRHREGRRY